MLNFSSESISVSSELWKLGLCSSVEVIRWADSIGDSFKLARYAADNHHADSIVFCGVHFMAESADVLTTAAHEFTQQASRLVAAVWRRKIFKVSN